MGTYAEQPTHRLLIMAALYHEADLPMPVDLVFTLNSRGVIFDPEELL